MHRQARSLAWSVREGVPVDALRDFNLAIMMGHDAHLAIDDDGDWIVTWPEHGIKPTLEQRSAAARWLADRGWGQAASLVQVEGTVRGELGAGSVQLGAMPAALVLAMADLLRGQLPAGDAPAIDAHALEVPSDASSNAREAPSSDE